MVNDDSHSISIFSTTYLSIHGIMHTNAEQFGIKTVYIVNVLGLMNIVNAQSLLALVINQYIVHSNHHEIMIFAEGK